MPQLNTDERWTIDALITIPTYNHEHFTIQKEFISSRTFILLKASFLGPIEEIEVTQLFKNERGTGAG